MAVETALVIDDSKSARIMLSRLVAKNGLEVAMVESGEEAIEHLKSSPLPDVIFMDHMMPGMSGLETTKIISENPETQHIPVLMYTSKEGAAYELELKEAGAYGMLGKPAKPERLIEILSELNSRSANKLNITAETTEEIIKHVTQPVIEEEEEEMSQELIEEVSSKLIAHAIEDALQPIAKSLQHLDTCTLENQSEIRKLISRQDKNVGLVSQAVLDASLKQTTIQMQAQLTSEIKAIRDLLEQRAELSPACIQDIKDTASKTASTIGAEIAEKTATSAAEAVAAKVAAAQAQIQLQQDMTPLIKQANKANMVAIAAIIIAGIAIASRFF